MVRRLHESIEDDANRLLDEISRLAFEVSEEVGEFAQSEDVFTELQYNSSSFERTELISIYIITSKMMIISPINHLLLVFIASSSRFLPCRKFAVP